MTGFATLPDNIAQRIADYKKKHPKTNADRIRAMTDEELATFLFNNVSCSDCTMHGGGCSIDCEKWMLSWLKAPVEEVDDER